MTVSPKQGGDLGGKQTRPVTNLEQRDWRGKLWMVTCWAPALAVVSLRQPTNHGGGGAALKPECANEERNRSSVSVPWSEGNSAGGGLQEKISCQNPGLSRKGSRFQCHRGTMQTRRRRRAPGHTTHPQVAFSLPVSQA